MNDAPSRPFAEKANYHFSEAKRLFKESFTHIPKQIMKKILTIIGTVIVGGVVVAAVVLHYSRDYKAEASEALQQAQDYRSRADELTCFYIGELTAKCYKKDSAACGMLQVSETEYQTEFGKPAYEACFHEESGTKYTVVEPTNDDSSSSPTTDPNFLGDEGNLPK